LFYDYKRENIMGFRFRKSFRVGKHARINLSKSGIGASVGVKGVRVGVGPRGKRTTLTVPGTGISYTKQTGKKKQAQEEPEQIVYEDPLPEHKTNCLKIVFIGFAGLVVFSMVVTACGALLSAFSGSPSPTPDSVDQAVQQLQSTLTMEAALVQAQSEPTDQPPTSTPEHLPTPIWVTFTCKECVTEDEFNLPYTLWETPDEIGYQSPQVLHGDRCIIVDRQTSSDGIDKSLVECPQGRGWTRTESLLP
jgi:hypothetical protein